MHELGLSGHFSAAFNHGDYMFPQNCLPAGQSRKEELILFIIASLLLLPLFFQMSNGIFKETSFYFNSGGGVVLLPLPLSIIVCGVGVVVLGGLAKVRLTMAVLLVTCMGMLVATLLLGLKFGSIEKSKLILLVQYVLPMSALVLGQQYGTRPGAVHIMAKAFTLILLLAVPAQLLSTFMVGLNILSPSLFLFSAYQHLQYIPVIFVGGFLIAVFALWDARVYRLLLTFLGGLMGVYASFSLSMLAAGFLILGLLCFTGYAIFLRKNRLFASVLTLLTVLMLVLSMSLVNRDLLAEKLGSHYSSEALPKIDGAKRKANEVLVGVPRNLTERAEYIKFYISEISQNPSSIFFGHPAPPSRSSYPSAHNYYLDFIYNFGVLAIVPLLGLAGFTVRSVIRTFSRVFMSSETVGVAGVVLFLLFADNMLKVGMRQPYPGLITFYLWGVLLAILLRLEKSKL